MTLYLLRCQKFNFQVKDDPQIEPLLSSKKTASGLVPKPPAKPTSIYGLTNAVCAVQLSRCSHLRILGRLS